MNIIKADYIDSIEPGCRVEIKGRTYIRINDIGHHHAGLLVDPESGWAGHWSKLVLFSEKVSTDAQWWCPSCVAVGCAHCAHPEECGGMKLRKPAKD